MKTVRHILVPVDHDAPSREALRWALVLARRFDAELAIMHGQRADEAFTGDSTVILFVRERVADVSAIVERQREWSLHAVLTELEDIGAPQRGIFIDAADPAHAIVDAARGADLIVIGSHGRTGAARLLHGSVAEEVARRAPCPVMIVRETG